MNHQKTFVKRALAFGLVATAQFLTGTVAHAKEANNDRPVVATSAGKVQGQTADGIVAYRGIPYAKAERFMPPQPVKKWTDTFQADHYGAICPQVDQNPFPGIAPKVAQSDDCQNLNVWTPSVRDGKKRAVMVWLHGGGFSGGSSMEAIAYEGKNLSKKGDVVVVSVNHRLNVMGHLDLSAYGPKYQYSANVGVMDLVASLKWVQANIGKFGGNPKNVTIFGESGGGAKVLTLMATPAAKGLFHKAIEQSGAVEGMGMNLTLPTAGRRVAELTLQALEIAPTELDRLKSVPYEKIASASAQALKKTAEEQKIPALQGPAFSLSWMPTMDGAYIPVQPVGGVFAKQSKNIPLITGSNLNEWVSVPDLINRDKLQSDNRNTWTQAQIDAKLKGKYGDKSAAIVEAFLKAYPGKKAVDALYVDTFLRLPALKTTQLKADQKAAPVYNYVFTWETPAFGGFGMAYHTAEIPFVFNNISITKDTTGDSQQAFALADKMSQAWINFAKTGTPSAPGMPKWQAATRENGASMIFDNTIELKQHHDAELLKLLTTK